MNEQTQDPGTGYLVVNVFTARGALPIENAVVLVKSNEEFGVNGIIQSLRTDKSGATPKIALPAPSASESMTPGYPTPYSTYNIEVYKDGYSPFESANVPVFENVTSIQPVELVPVGEHLPPESNFIEVPHNTTL